MSNIGRRSLFSKEQQDFFASSRNFKEEIKFQAIVIDVCDSSKPKSKFLKKEFKKGITLIVVPYENCKVYAVQWNSSKSNLISDEGTKENIIGREVTICSKSRKEFDVFSAKVTFNGEKLRETEDDSAPGFRSMSFSANMYTDYESQMLNNRENGGGRGEIPPIMGRGNS